MLDYLESLGIELDQIEELLEVYDEAVMQSIDLDNMKEIVDIMRKEGLSFEEMKDLVLTSFELFTYDVSYIKERWELVRQKYPDNTLDKIMESPEILYEVR